MELYTAQDRSIIGNSGHSSGSLAQAHAGVDDRFLAKLLQDQLCCRLFGYMRRKDMITYLRADL